MPNLVDEKSQLNLVDEMLNLLKEPSCSRQVGWYVATVKRQSTINLIGNVIQRIESVSMTHHDWFIWGDCLLKIAGERLGDTIEDRLIKIQQIPFSTESKAVPATVSTFLQTFTKNLKMLLTALGRIPIMAPSEAIIRLEAINQDVPLPGLIIPLDEKKDKESKIEELTTGCPKGQEKTVIFLIAVVSEFTSQTLAQRYFSILSNLITSDVDKFAEYAVWNVIEGLRERYCKSSPDEILKFITNQPQKYIQELCSYVDRSYLPSMNVKLNLKFSKEFEICAGGLFKKSETISLIDCKIEELIALMK